MTELLIPHNMEELSSFLTASANLEKYFVAGGTDWLVKNRKNLSESAMIFDFSKIIELRGIKLDERSLRIGAMETMTSIHSNKLIKQYAAALADAAATMGSAQIRNRATIGGNLANASPAADTPCALAALDASVTVFSPSGSRYLSIEEVLDSCPNTNRLEDSEIIKEFSLPLRNGYVSAFKKIGSRSEVSIARVNMALSARYESGIFNDARVFVGTLGNAARRCPGAEKALTLPPSLREQGFKKALCEFAEQMIPGRSTLPYKKSAFQALAEDLLAMLEKRGKSLERGEEKRNG